MVVSILLLTILLIFSIGFTQPQQGNQPENSCNACCQGAAGIPGLPGPAGIPGSTGHNGFPGRDGIKGEKGESGVGIKGDKGDTGLGQKGLPGPEGPAGESGPPGLQGAPGKTGPRGLPGMTGQKGESRHTRRSAFTAVKTSDQTGNIGDVVTFQETPTNINNHFNLGSNKFTCQIPGTYVFMFAIGLYRPQDVFIWLMKNGNLVVTAHTRTGGIGEDFDQTSNSAILNLEVGDQVWIQFGYENGRSLHSNTQKYTSFSGFLLYEN